MENNLESKTTRIKTLEKIVTILIVILVLSVIYLIYLWFVNPNFFTGLSSAKNLKKENLEEYFYIEEIENLNISGKKSSVKIVNSDEINGAKIYIEKNKEKKFDNSIMDEFKTLSIDIPKYHEIFIELNFDNLKNLNFDQDSGSIYIDGEMQKTISLNKINLSIILDAGEIEVKNLITNTGNIRLDAGSLNINNLKSNDLDLITDVGNIELKEVDSRILIVKTDVGNIGLDKVIFEKADLTTDVGSIEVKTDNDFNFKIDPNSKIDLGDIEIKDLNDFNTNNILKYTISVGSFEVN